MPKSIFPKDAMSQLRADAFTFKSQEFMARTLEVMIKELVETLNKKREEEITAEDVKKVIEEADKVEFEGNYPTGKPFKEEIRRKDTD